MIFLIFKKKQQSVITLRSTVNGTITVGKSHGQITVFSSGVQQSGGEFVFMWEKVLSALKKEYKQIENALILGVGGGTSIQVLQKTYPHSTILGVELDPMMIRIAKQYFHIQESKKIKLIRKDAIQYVMKNKKIHKYDLVINDLYIGALNPKASRTKSYLIKLKQLVKKSGCVLYNCHFQQNKKEEFDVFFTKCQTVFSHVEIVFSFQRNHIFYIKP